MTRDEMMTALKQAQDFIGSRAKMACVGDGAMLLYSWVRALDLAIHELETPGEQEAGKKSARLLSAREFRAIETGIGWMENMFGPDEIWLERIAWTGGNTATESGHSTVERLCGIYNQPMGIRIWVGDEPPTDAQREAAPWTGSD